MFLRPLPTDIFLLELFEFFNKYIFSILKRKSITGYCSFKHTTARIASLALLKIQKCLAGRVIFEIELK